MNIKKLPAFTRLNFSPKNFGGFTIVEILIIAPIVIIVIGVFVSVIINMTGEVLSTRASNAMVFSVQNALNLIEQDVKLSGAFLATNNIALSSPQGYNDDTTNFHNADATNGTSLILNAFTTSTNPLVSTRDLVYADNQPNACASALVKQNLPVMMNIVYFVKNNSLWRRIIMPATYASVGCVGGVIGAPWQQPSCVPGYNSTIDPLSFCKAQDMLLIDGVNPDDFVVNYYPSTSSTTADSIASDTTKTDAERLVALQSNSTVGVTINAAKTIAGRNISQSGTIRSVSPNNNTSVNYSIKSLTTIAGTGGTVSAGGTYDSGSTQTITATANSYYTFSSWTGSTGCSGLASHTITMDENKTCTANFTNIGDVYYFLKTLSTGDTTIATTYASIDLEMVVFNTSQTISVNTSWGNATADTRMLGVRVEGDLTVNAGVTLTAAARKRGMVIYVTGNTTINGTISMTARGASAAGQKVLLLYDGTEYYVPAVGGAGGASIVADNGNGNTGTSGVATGGPGGGGGGGTSTYLTVATGGKGGDATSYSGGPGGGGGGGVTGQCSNIGTAGSDSGGSGGYGTMCGGDHGGGGGAGNPGGSSCCIGATASSGTGGLLVLYVKGTLTFGASGTLSSIGATGGNNPYAYNTGGGGSGGGRIDYFYKTLSGSATINVAGGTKGGVGYPTYGGTGGAGSSRAVQYNF